MAQEKLPPSGKKTTNSGSSDREARLKAALKSNMARRKAQARARGAGQETDAQAENGVERKE